MIFHQPEQIFAHQDKLPRCTWHLVHAPRQLLTLWLAGCGKGTICAFAGFGLIGLKRAHDGVRANLELMVIYWKNATFSAGLMPA